jgi:hypothetical protein
MFPKTKITKFVIFVPFKNVSRNVNQIKEKQHKNKIEKR